MMKYGFECEYWVCKDIVDDALSAKPVNLSLVPKGLPKDECGYLAEVRGDPHNDPEKAAALFRVEEKRTIDLFEKEGLLLWNGSGAIQLPKKFLYEALLRHGKAANPYGRGNIYGKSYKPFDRWARAGLHIHFSDEYPDKDGKMHCRMIDMPKYIQALDKAFEKEIKEMYRLPGFYEMKPHGFEYRSLPCSASLEKVVDVLRKID